ncbi:BgTH12-03148 [Blumeria graminis f. sp. triticale]|uniref:BgtE-5923 n=3 Tax=Blumeria graminis TaxID=34373 RepID=A0A061HN75_BLUGR|nr:putative secreted effector protein [Blumeria graminis f. sp. tritici 96224]CAD6503485.1 BgTH12-03148 [Blumeria graminis f. sp. triticale]VDB89582.1 BgtE-5923 [Blumeria graminis f. sp. tritici]
MKVQSFTGPIVFLSALLSGCAAAPYNCNGIEINMNDVSKTFGLVHSGRYESQLLKISLGELYSYQNVYLFPMSFDDNSKVRQGEEIYLVMSLQKSEYGAVQKIGSNYSKCT